jgi:hypothetical protein
VDTAEEAEELLRAAHKEGMLVQRSGRWYSPALAIARSRGNSDAALEALKAFSEELRAISARRN